MQTIWPGVKGRSRRVLSSFLVLAIFVSNGERCLVIQRKARSWRSIEELRCNVTEYFVYGGEGQKSFSSPCLCSHSSSHATISVVGAQFITTPNRSVSDGNTSRIFQNKIALISFTRWAPLTCQKAIPNWIQWASCFKTSCVAHRILTWFDNVGWFTLHYSFPVTQGPQYWQSQAPDWFQWWFHRTLSSTTVVPTCILDSG